MPRSMGARLARNAMGACSALAILGLLAPFAAEAADSVASGDTSSKKIALSNNYAGNSWRQAMLGSWAVVAKGAVDKKLIGEAPAFTTAENSPTEQAAQIQNLVLQGYDAIVVDAASPTALNGAIKEACDAGIIVVSFDAIVSEPCAWRIKIDFEGMGKTQMAYLAQRMKGGKLLEIRGQAGSSVDDEIHKGIEDGIKTASGFSIVGSVNGDWTQTVAQRQVAGILPTLPAVDAVVTQGGDGYGTAQAFLAAGKPVPTIIMGNRYEELKWWKEQDQKGGYKSMSLSIAPGASQVGFWVAQQILAGKKVPKELTLPTLVVEQDKLDYWLAHTPDGGVSNATYPQAWVAELIDAAAAGKEAPATPLSQ